MSVILPRQRRSRAQPRVAVELRFAELEALRFAMLRPGVRSGMGIVRGTRRGATQTPLQLAINRIDEVWVRESGKKALGNGHQALGEEKTPRGEAPSGGTPSGSSSPEANV